MKADNHEQKDFETTKKKKNSRKANNYITG